MPLPPAANNRTLIHTRTVECRGFERADGLFDIEGSIVDVKSHPIERDIGANVPAGAPIHKMAIRLTVDADLVVHDVAAATDAAPFAACLEAAAPMAALKGLRIGAGWSRHIRELLGGAKGCTHLMELLGPVATTAYQTLVKIRWSRPDVLDRNGRPSKIDSCYAYASSGPVVRHKWPDHYTGSKS